MGKLPWKPPPTTSVTPGRMPMPLTVLPLASAISVARDDGEVKRTVSPSVRGTSDAPDALHADYFISVKDASRKAFTYMISNDALSRAQSAMLHLASY